MKLKNLIPKKILQESGGDYDYSCVMLYFDFPKNQKIHEIISKNDIYTDETDNTFGLESETHITLLYGLHPEVSAEDVKSVISKFSYGTCEFLNCSIFENEKYDVLKFDARGKNLTETNEELKKFPYTSDYPDYHPHSTIAYLKPGTGKKYTEIFEKMVFSVLPTKVVYSEANDTKTDIGISIDEGSSAEYYRKNPVARKKKQAYDAKLNKDPKQVKKRVEANAARRKATKAGKNIKGKDASHTKNGIRFKESSKNRGSKSDSKGDKNARGGGKRKK